MIEVDSVLLVFPIFIGQTIFPFFFSTQAVERAQDKDPTPGCAGCGYSIAYANLGLWNPTPQGTVRVTSCSFFLFKFQI